MKKIVLTVLSISAALMSCKNEPKKDATTETKETTPTTQKTYAELSIRANENWEPKKYGGGAFKNVDSLQLPEGHSDHAYYIRYEGPGWENSNVGYRLYLDWRNAIDIFGKKVDTMSLAYVGQNDYERYHHEAPWGQDILKAGKSLGIGGFGRFVNDSVIHFRTVDKTVCYVNNTDEKSNVKLSYTGWHAGDVTTNLDAVLSIFPEDRFTRADMNFSTPIEGFCTGIVKFNDITFQQKTSESGEWAYIATYGTQTLVNETDKLGMAIFYNTSEVTTVTDGPYDHLVVFKPAKKVTYYFLAAWQQEPNGITSQEAFYNYLNNKLETLETTGALNK
ncbi:hypothetical protein NBRC110019_24640 [Neptunitalea chrysea]|uniref:DUF4861 domain-containing protein n=1 Tax=Neptunitalea chrysea TaxID=1647581 RepID=A0A9W6EWR4_9FLAO|nr:DUF4861 family protein [Neptunitalea chrysea]GLB53423.1 hypothetical protein NBRC110019_24640 [Neptunitalea chrysea]